MSLMKKSTLVPRIRPFHRDAVFADGSARAGGVSRILWLVLLCMAPPAVVESLSEMVIILLHKTLVSAATPARIKPHYVPQITVPAKVEVGGVSPTLRSPVS